MKHGLLMIALAMLAVGVGGLVATSGFAGAWGPLGGFTSNGQRIFFTGADASGWPIPYRGGMMMRTACANCHGPDGRGLSTPMFVSPDITYNNLTSPEGMMEPDGSR